MLAWLLLVPPLTNDVPPSSDPHAPLARWQLESEHDSAGDCEQARRDFQSLYEDALVFYAICVAEQDPRLKPQGPPDD